MNNPLNRSMFRQAGMSKQPMGILASSPELMTTAQQAMASGQPVMAQVGTSVNTQATKGFGLNQSPSVPSGVGNFIKNAFTKDSPSSLGQVINYGLKGLSAKKDSDADKAAEIANQNAKNKTISSYSQAGITSATGPEIGITSAGDVDEKDGLIFDGDKFNFYENQKNAPSILSDLKAKSKDFKEAYTNAPSNLLNSVKKYVSKSSVARGETGDKKSNVSEKETVDFENKSFFDNLKNMGKNFIKPSIDALKTGLKLHQDREANREYEEALSGENIGNLTKKQYRELLNVEQQERDDQFKAKEKLSPGEGVDTGKTNVLKPAENKTTKGKDVTKSAENKSDGGKLSFNQLQAEILDADRKSEKGYKDGQRTAEGNEFALKRDLLAGVGLNTSESDNNKTFTSDIGATIGVDTSSMNIKERHAMYKEMLRGITGDSPKDLKSDANFNLIMTGLLIASGDSPNAMTNIARGMAQGLKNYGDSLSADRKEKKEIEIASFKLAVTADEAEKGRTFQKEEKRKDRVTTTLNTLIKEYGSSNNKFGQQLTATVAANIKDYMTREEYANFKTLPESQKSKIIVGKVNSIYDISPFSSQKKDFNVEAIIQGTTDGKIPKNIVKDKTEELNKNFSEYSFKKIG